MRTAEELNASWRQDERWAGIIRPYRAEDVVRLRGSIGIERTLARIGAERLWSLLPAEDPGNAFELTKALIEAGASAVHFEDQLASAKKCGHLGGKVLVSTGVFLQKLVAARIASDLCDVPTILIARTDANSAKLITTDVDPRDQPFIIDAERTTEGFHRFRGGIDASIARGLAYAPYADLLWCETSGPDLDEARTFADAIHARFPEKMLAYNCSSSFNWRKKLDRETIAQFQRELAEMGYRFQFVTLAGFHALNLSMFKLARGYQQKGLTAYAELQDAESDAKAEGYRAFEHQTFVGTAYFDEIAQVITGGDASTLAMAGSTEKEQFHEAAAKFEPVESPPPRLNATETG